MSQLIQHIEYITHTQIDNEQLIYTAFRHTSYVNEHRRENLESNERLEFLGDAVLELATSQYLYDYYPNKSEGDLSRLRALLVQEASLARLAKQFNFDYYIRLGRGESQSGGASRPSILSDCFEAFLGAIYLDQGMKPVQAFLNKHLLEDHENFLAEINRDYKTLLQEVLQQNGTVSIQYRELKKTGPAHNQVFEMGLYLNGKFLAKGMGKSKKAAEMQAARQAYEALNKKSRG